jgi:hypothetical protein
MGKLENYSFVKEQCEALASLFLFQRPNGSYDKIYSGRNRLLLVLNLPYGPSSIDLPQRKSMGLPFVAACISFR